MFNPGSRVHIEKKLRELGWKPTEFTGTGRAEINEETLSKINIPEAAELIEYLMIQKRLGQIGDGNNAWLKLVSEDGLIHARYNPMGTPHGRASHNTPNIAQVPNAKAVYGNECRELFVVPKGWKQVGADMSGCQLRCLAHYIAHFDGGKYAEIVTTGDIHEYHREVTDGGIRSRDDAKTTIYALIFGAQAPRIGLINGGGAVLGNKIMLQLRKRIPGFDRLLKAVQSAASKGWVRGLDGRRIPVRSKHSALNFLIAGCEAVLCKQWLVDSYDQLRTRWNYGWDGDVVILGWIHDEIQVACREGIEDEVAEVLVTCAVNAGKPHGFKVTLKSDSKIGNNWKECH